MIDSALIDQMQDIFQKLTLHEGIIVIASLLYSVLLLKEMIWCWLFGIIASLASIYLFYEQRLYGTAILHTYYVLIGIYGWYYWKKKGPLFAITIWPLTKNLVVIGILIILSIVSGWALSIYTNGRNTYIDAAITLFSFLATFKETKKVLDCWIYWIVINIMSLILYFNMGIYLYSLLMFLYTIISFWGYWEWRCTFSKNSNSVL